MISDVLSDAAIDIKEYLEELPDVYETVKPEILEVLKAMEKMRITLDAPPCMTTWPANFGEWRKNHGEN